FRTVDRPVLRGVEPGALATPEARLRAAAFHWVEGRLEDADDELSRLPPAPPLAPELRVARARLLFLLGRFVDAWAELDALLAIRPDDPVVRRYHRALTVLSEPAVAPSLERALVPHQGRWFADPGPLGELLLRLAVERADQETLHTALEQLEAALRLNPGKIALLGSYGIGLASAARLDEAGAAFRRALELEPGDARMHYNLGTLHERRGDPAEAARSYVEAARLSPGWGPPRQRLAALGIQAP
ncbi:MAG TPA: tetratricopeptide repeat protein, partial [Gemmatimonadales bacterium]|nr:tetratricopeptide repeat protein [Gemmatimonadales bacterium]